jgi:hypothetical protein
MKKIFVLLGMICLLASCSMDDDRVKFEMEFLSAVPVELPEYMQPGQTYEFRLQYSRPTDCYYFDGFYYEAEGNSHVIAVQALVIVDAECVSLEGNAPEEAVFQVTCAPNYQLSSYHFKFYQGEDASGVQQFMEVDIPVQQ